MAAVPVRGTEFRWTRKTAPFPKEAQVHDVVTSPTHTLAGGLYL
jgi:hypothetical protein